MTQVDVCIQEFVRAGLESLCPEIQFMGEEKDNHTIDFSKPFWIMDPVDGTTNLIHDFKCSCISLALCVHGKIVFGVICHLYLNELFYAIRGKGAWLNGKRLSVSRTTELSQGLICTGTSPYYKKELGASVFEDLKNVYFNCEDIRRTGSAALDMAWVAAGRADACFERRLCPWDFAAGIILIEEAGGSVSDFLGAPLEFYKKCDVIGGNGIINEHIRTRLLTKK